MKAIRDKLVGDGKEKPDRTYVQVGNDLFRQLLFNKMTEESAEILQADHRHDLENLAEELGDLIDVCYGIAHTYGLVHDVEQKRFDKHRKRGGFYEGWTID